MVGAEAVVDPSLDGVAGAEVLEDPVASDAVELCAKAYVSGEKMKVKSTTALNVRSGHFLFLLQVQKKSESMKDKGRPKGAATATENRPAMLVKATTSACHHHKGKSMVLLMGVIHRVTK